MSFTQDFFSSRRNQADGNIRIGELDRLWYDSITNTIRISNGNPGGKIVGGGASVTLPADAVGYLYDDGAGNLSWANISTYSNVNVQSYLTVNPQPGTYSNTNVATYLSTTAITGNLDLGNLYITDETIGGKIDGRDITLSPAGNGLVSVTGLKIPVGSVVQGVSNITAVITNLTVSSVIDYSTSVIDNLSVGEYGLTNGISGADTGWTVYEFTTTPLPILQINDVISGIGIPSSSKILFVGNISGTDSANANIVITTNTVNSLPPIVANTVVYTSREVVNAGLAITTRANVDITFNPAVGGNVVSASSLIPLVDGVYDLGSPAKRWHHVWVGAGTIYVLDETLGTDQAIGARGGNLYISGGSGLTVGEFTLFNNYLALNNPASDFYIGVQTATGNLIFNRPIRVNSPAGENAFSVSRFGLTTIHAPITLANTQSVLSIIGSISGNVQPRNFSNTMIHVTGQDDSPTRISFDAFGASGTPVQNSYVAIASRIARGNVDYPSTTLAGDTILRFTGQGWTGNGVYASSIIRLNLEAAETFTSNLSTGTRLTIQTTPVGSNTIQPTAAFYSNGMHLYGNTITTGIKFADSTFQNTAFSYNNVVRKIITGDGFANAGTYTGNVTLNTIDVHSLLSNSYSLTVNNPDNSQYITLHLAQEIAPNSSPTFNNLTVGNLTVSNVFTTVTNASINGKILYLANNSTSNTQISGGGIILGNTAQDYYRSILYDLNNDRWDTDGCAFKTLSIEASDGNFLGNIHATGILHLGYLLEDTHYANAAIQADFNVNDFGQIVINNHNSGTNASADFVATNDIGDENNNYIDMGINSSTYYNSDYTIMDHNSGYLYVQGNVTGAVQYGNLIIGTGSANTVIKFHTSGLDVTDERVRISDSGLSTPLPITSTVITGTSPFDISSTTLVNNLYASRALRADSLNPGATINGVSYQGNSAITVTANASTLTGTYLSPTVVNSSLQTVGTLTNLTVTGNINVSSWINANASGAFSGNVYTNYFIGSGRYLTELPSYAYGNTNVDAYIATYITPSLYSNANVASYLPTYSGNIGNVKTTANIITTGYYFGSGRYLTELPSYAYGNTNVAAYIATYITPSLYSNANVASYLPTYSGNIGGTLLTAAQPNITSVGNLTSLATSGNISTTQYFIGNGSQLTGLPATYGNTQVASYLPTYSGNIGNVKTTANIITTGYYFGNGSQLTGINSFGHLAVSGQTTIDSTTTNDTLTVVAGTNISVTTSGKNLTITNLYGNANVDSYLTTNGYLTTTTANLANYAWNSNVTLANTIQSNQIDAINANIGNLQANITTINGSITNISSNVALTYVLNGIANIGNVSGVTLKNTLHSLFRLTNGVAVTANTRYIYEIVFNTSYNKTGVMSYALANSAQVTQHNFTVMSNKTTTIDGYTAGITAMSFNANVATVTTAKAIADIDNFNHTVIHGTIDVSTSGNVNFMVSQDQNTPVTWNILPGSYVRLYPVGAIGANTQVGTWN
jgi:hypothetical protein